MGEAFQKRTFLLFNHLQLVSIVIQEMAEFLMEAFTWARIAFQKKLSRHLKSSKSQYHCEKIFCDLAEQEAAQWLTFFLPDPAVRGSILGIPKIISEEKIIDIAKANQQHW